MQTPKAGQVFSVGHVTSVGHVSNKRQRAHRPRRLPPNRLAYQVRTAGDRRSGPADDDPSHPGSTGL
jgi:hypothetical protein